MSVVIIVNIILSLSLVLGGVCMRKYAVSPVDYSIGFRTKRAMSGDDAWLFANQTCGKLWLISGAAGFVLTIAAVFAVRDTDIAGRVQLGLLILQIAAAVCSCAFVEMKLKSRFAGK